MYTYPTWNFLEFYLSHESHSTNAKNSGISFLRSNRSKETTKNCNSSDKTDNESLKALANRWRELISDNLVFGETKSHLASHQPKRKLTDLSRLIQRETNASTTGKSSSHPPIRRMHSLTRNRIT